MTPAAIDQLTAQLKTDEGFRQFPYQDTVGILTVAYGRNLKHVGISRDEGEVLLRNDIDKALSGCARMIPGFPGFDDARQAVLVNMTFNMGIGGVLAFKKMLEAVRAGDYFSAATEMLDSQWARQVGARADRLARIMQTGVME